MLMPSSRKLLFSSLDPDVRYGTPKLEKTSQHEKLPPPVDDSDFPVTPGLIVTKFKMPRPEMGSDMISISFMTSEILAVVVSTCVSCPETATVCVISPTSSEKFIPMVDCAVTSMPLLTTFLK